MNKSQVSSNNSVRHPVELHPSEQKLIETIRSINSGEIESIKIQNGLPVIFKITLGEGKFCEEDSSGRKDQA